MNKTNLPDKIFGIPTVLALLWLKPLILSLVIIFSLSLVIVPKIGEISEKMDQISQVGKKRIEVLQKRTYLQSVDQEELKSNANLLSLGVLPEKNSYILVKVIGGAAAANGYVVDDFSISLGEVKQNETKKTNPLGYDKIPVVITLSGPQEKYLNLVKTIERSLPVISIDNFEMRTIQSGVSTIKLSVSAYYLKDSANIKVENLSLADLTLSQEEAELLSIIKEYQPVSSGANQSNEGGSFVKYERSDPFFTP